MPDRQNIVRKVPLRGRGYEYWHGYIPRTRSWMWCLDLYEDGEALAGGRHIREADARVAALLWEAGITNG